MTNDELVEEARTEQAVFNRVMVRLTSILGLSTGIGVVAWGAWSMVINLGMTIYERSGLDATQIAIEDAFNQGLLQSAMLIALGVVILELRRISHLLTVDRHNG